MRALPWANASMVNMVGSWAQVSAPNLVKGASIFHGNENVFNIRSKEAAAAALSDADKLVELKAIVLGIQRVFWRLKTHKVRVNV